MSSTYLPVPPKIASLLSSNPSLKEPLLKQLSTTCKNISSGPAESSVAACKAAKAAKDDEVLLSAAHKSKHIVAQQALIPLDLSRNPPLPDANTEMVIDDLALPDEDLTLVDAPMAVTSNNCFEPLQFAPTSSSQLSADDAMCTILAMPPEAPDGHTDMMPPGVAEFIADFCSQYSVEGATPQVHNVDEALRLGLILPSDVTHPGMVINDDPFVESLPPLPTMPALPSTPVLPPTVHPVPILHFLSHPQTQTSPSNALTPSALTSLATPLLIIYAVALVHTASGSATGIAQVSHLAAKLGAANLNAPVPIHTQSASITTSLYTNGPFPIIHEAHLLATLTFISQDQLFDWENIQGAKLVARPLDISHDLITHMTMASMIQCAVLEITNFADTCVAAPVLTFTPQSSQYPLASTPFLVFNITDVVAQIMLSRGVWLSTSVTFQALTLEPGLSQFLFTIAGFTTADTPTVCTLIHNQWHSEDSQHALVAIATDCATQDSQLNDDNIIAFMMSLHVEHINTMGRGTLLLPRFNIYTDPTIISYEEHWFALCQHFRDLPYISNLYGIGRA
ncbi:hypothetical protein EWM64_g7305 [Hericium alpestre]|uniref:Uncharacterized protein n=1 Tax=Hericium alpestre TaxID=135208 RepID=A0A4Y9ZRN2_9AGAM|nr:hypothetical protein EWM64_g7305 [Hericium alpestre]